MPFSKHVLLAVTIGAAMLEYSGVEYKKRYYNLSGRQVVALASKHESDRASGGRVEQLPSGTSRA